MVDGLAATSQATGRKKSTRRTIVQIFVRSICPSSIGDKKLSFSQLSLIIAFVERSAVRGWQRPREEIYSLETLLILLIVVGVVAGFTWLRRLIGDEWPLPVPAEQEPQPPAETPAAPTSATPSPFLPEAPTRDVSKPPTLSLPVTASQEFGTIHAPVAEQGALVVDTPPAPPSPRLDSPPPLPPAAIAQQEPPTGIALRYIIWTLTGGGLLLLALAQAAARAAPPGQRLPSYLLFLAGALFFLVGIQSTMRGGLPSRIGQILARLSAFLRVTPAQVSLLALSLGFAWLARQAAGDGLLAHQALVATLAWLLAIALVIAGSANRREGDPAQRLDLSRWDLILSIGLFALALALRATEMTRFPNVYSGDEGSAGLFALELLTGKANNLFGVGWFSFPAFYFTVQSAAIALLGQTIEAVRLTSALAGALTVVALYWLGRAMFDRTTALLAALYLAASHYHIHMSRIALNNVWDALFGTLAIFGLWYGWRSGRRWAFILCGVALGLGQYFYVSIRILPLLFLIWAAFAFWRHQAQFRQRFNGLVLAALIALIVYLPLGLYFLDNPDEFQAPLNRVSIFGRMAGARVSPWRPDDSRDHL
jgi:hypothetical protein